MEEAHPPMCDPGNLISWQRTGRILGKLLDACVVARDLQIAMLLGPSIITVDLSS